MKKSPSKGWSKKKFEGEWAQTLQRFLAKQQDTVPEGWLRGDEAIRAMGFKGSTSGGSTNRTLNAMVKAKVILKKEFRIFDGSGRRISSISHYKLA